MPLDAEPCRRPAAARRSARPRFVGRTPAAHRLPQLSRACALERRPAARRAHRGQRLRQDQPSRSRVAADAGPGSAPRALSRSWRASGGAAGRSPPGCDGAGSGRDRHRAKPAGATGTRAGRIVRIDGEDQSGSGALGDHVEMVWLTPAMDGLFTGPGSERRRFLDRLIPSHDPGYRTRTRTFRARHAPAQSSAARTARGGALRRA